MLREKQNKLHKKINNVPRWEITLFKTKTKANLMYFFIYIKGNIANTVLCFVHLFSILLTQQRMQRNRANQMSIHPLEEKEIKSNVLKKWWHLAFNMPDGKVKSSYVTPTCEHLDKYGPDKCSWLSCSQC
jgi:hypothetical protein